MKNMKHLLVFLILVSLTTSSFAQLPSLGLQIPENRALLGPGDKINVVIYDQKSFDDPGQSFELVISESGKITLPIIGDFWAYAKTPDDLEKAILRSVSQFVTEPIVSVTVVERVSKRAALVGAFTSQGLYPIRLGMTVTEFIALNDGLTPTADTENIYVLRETGEFFQLNLKSYFEFGNVSEDIELEPGDKVYAPQLAESWWVKAGRILSVLTLALQVVILALVINN